MVYEDNVMKFNESTFPFYMVSPDTETNYSSDSRWHRYIEFVCLTEGETEIDICNEKVKMKKGNLLIIGNNVVHSVKQVGNTKSKQYIMYFPREFLLSSSTNAIETKYFNEFFEALRLNCNYFIIDLKDSAEEILDLFKLSFKEYEQKKQPYELIIKSYVLMIVAKLIRKDFVTIMSDHYSETYISKISESIEYIRNHYNEDLSLKYIADRANISYYYFSKLFFKISGKCFKEYLDYTRIIESEKLMYDKKYNISEICQMVGIPNQSCFNRTYKRIRGLSPREYRKKIEAEKRR